MIKFEIVIPLLCVGVCLTGCDKPKVPTSETTTFPMSENHLRRLIESPPVFDATFEKPTLLDVDPATINPVNNGYTLDLTGPGSQDFLIMNGGKVYWSKGDKKDIVVLTVKGDIIAYGVETGGIRVYNRQYKGFFAKYLGNNNGVPYFGKLEE